MKSFIWISRLLVSALLILLFANFQIDKDRFPDPVVKIGMAKITGSIVNLKLPDGDKRVVLSVFVYNPITGNDDITTYTTTIDEKNRFVIQVPLECNTEICGFNIGNNSKLFGWGYIGLDQSKELKLNLVFDDNGKMLVNATGGLSFSTDDILNICEAYGLFEDCHTWGEFQTMSPKEFLDHELNISLKKRMSAVFDSLAFSDKVKRYLKDDIKLRFYKGRLFYYKETVEQSLKMNKILTTDTVVEPDKSYYTFLKDLDLNNPQYLYCEDYKYFLKRFLQIPAFKIPDINEIPIDEWLSTIKKSISGVVGFSSGFFYDLLATKAYIYQIKNDQTPLTKQQIINIQAFFTDDRKDLGKLIIASNNQLIIKLNECQDLKINETPNAIKGNVVDAIVSKYKGSVVVVDLWATWCGPCIKAMSDMKSLKIEMKQKGVIFAYITNRSSPEDLWKSTIKTIGGEQYYLINGEWDTLMEYYNLKYIPSYLIFDKSGELKQKITGFPGEEKMRKMIEDLVGQ
ncbi:MAG TPA: TlpA disulfide reductase family protein [Paludibacter sp.]